MSRLRIIALAAVAALAIVTVGCSSDGKADDSTAEKAYVFGDGPTKSTRVGVCGAYKIAAMKKIVGGGRTFRVLAPTAIGKKGDPVTGETCSWQRGEAGKDFMTLQVEARKFNQDQAALTDRMAELQGQTVGAKPVSGVGEGAFSAVGPLTSLLQVRQGAYFLTFASSAQGKLKPVPLETLKFIAGAALAKLPE